MRAIMLGLAMLLAGCETMPVNPNWSDLANNPNFQQGLQIIRDSRRPLYAPPPPSQSFQCLSQRSGNAVITSCN